MRSFWRSSVALELWVLRAQFGKAEGGGFAARAIGEHVNAFGGGVFGQPVEQLREGVGRVDGALAIGTECVGEDVAVRWPVEGDGREASAAKVLQLGGARDG